MREDTLATVSKLPCLTETTRTGLPDLAHRRSALPIR